MNNVFEEANITGVTLKNRIIRLATLEGISDENGRPTEELIRKLGIARFGLACCLCSENIKCSGCSSGECPDKERRENRFCVIILDIF